MRVNRNEVDVAPVVRIVTPSVGRRDAFSRYRVDGQVCCSQWVGEVVVVCRRWEERDGAHRRRVVVKVVSLIVLIRAFRIDDVARVNYQRRFLRGDPLRNEALCRTGVSPAAVTKNDELERSG